MTGRLIGLISGPRLIRLAVFPLLAILTLLVTGDSGQAQQAACKCFVPVPSTTYSETTPGSHPDIAGTFNVGLGPDGTVVTPDDTGDYNFGGTLTLSPSAPADAEVQDGAILGTVKSTAVLGVLNDSCSKQIPVEFTFQEGTTDITNTVDMLEFGIGNELAVMAGDNPPFNGQKDVNPAPAVTKYPAFLNAIFDPDWVDYGPDKKAGNADDNDGPAPPIKPRFRAVGATYIGFAQLWVILQTVVFEPGTDLPQLPAFDAAYGYPGVTVLQTASAAGSATPPIAGAITDFCTPLKVNTTLPGVTQDNPDTGPNEGGVALRTMPAAAGVVIPTIGYYISQRDADGDGYENGLDPCPFHADTVWNPRDLTKPFEGDGPDTTAAGPVHDGIPDTCDPSAEASSDQGGQPTDHDGDGFPNRGDNCPLVFNKGQEDKDKNSAGEEVGDGIGDVCDQPGTDAGTDCVGENNCTPGGGLPGPRPIPARSVAGAGPGTPDGAEIVCIKISTVTVGGPGEAAVSDCLTALPAITGPGGTIDTSSLPGAGTGAGAGSAAGAGGTAGTGAGGGAGGGVGGPVTGIGSLSPVAGTVPAWAAIAGALGTAGMIGALGTLASRFVQRRRDS